TQQSGIAFNLRMANLATDGQIVQLARDAAEDVLAGNPVITGGTPPDGSARATALPLGDADLRILAAELSRRFAHEVDWSVIS
ncbi:MAG: hypothetical protein K2H21_08955, partial [Muribaculaceae bacterium]|nr:hypothetical protein [Muribaculaceae bacterium]